MTAVRWTVLGVGAAVAAVALERRRRARKRDEAYSGSRPIEGVGTATAGFVGTEAPKGTSA